MVKPPRTKTLLGDDKVLRSRGRRQRDKEQPNLPLDPLPDRIAPCLAQLRDRPPQGEKWAYEIKWDGYRLAIHKELAGVRVLTRGGHDWTHRFPGIVEAVENLGVATAIFDGEAVVLDEAGRSDFGLLQKALGGRGGKKAAGEALFIVFDLLYLDGFDLRSLGLTGRRQLLEGVVPPGESGIIRLSESFETDGETLLETARQHGLEGIIAKDRNAPYRSGRTGDWIKVKCIASDSFFIVGYEPSAVARGGVGSLLLGAYQDDEIVHVGACGTGFGEDEARALKKMMDRLVTKRPPVVYDGRQKHVVWLEPTLIAEIEYRAWTDDEKLRHASYKGLRDIQDNAEVYRFDADPAR
ncbi:non-homologous end-joining DNA ligase [Oryzifoliimicrobium ureilyticus]|uniref:non-homologous end-joining DNA ligase n=1 Tax=Oryzifoliimicrobium ureilyticus TaxID=3113724 RepID=UPI0030765DE6